MWGWGILWFVDIIKGPGSFLLPVPSSLDTILVLGLLLLMVRRWQLQFQAFYPDKTSSRVGKGLCFFLESQKSEKNFPQIQSRLGLNTHWLVPASALELSLGRVMCRIGGNPNKSGLCLQETRREMTIG